ncbi:MAG: 23S rRNA (pseudouridine(1915)-N(3))-methyltransferase RlmH [Tissierellia bacterium]|nr:23S rRNA (pseudouridine(1915)-N(3))-methyltransferase RlmH [Tissierellia bacterium]
MNIDIIAIGDIKEKYLKDAIKEYDKRIKPYSSLNIIELPESKLPNNPSPADINSAMQKEGEKILEKINPRAYVIALCIEGKQLSSEAFSGSIQNITIEGYSEIAFIIGGSNGLSNEVKQRANHKLSFSKMTFPHQLMRVILMEQIYRAFRIMRNEPYHK